MEIFSHSAASVAIMVFLAILSSIILSQFGWFLASGKLIPSKPEVNTLEPEVNDDLEDIIAKMNNPPPEPSGELELWSIANWCRLYKHERDRCVNHLLTTMLALKSGPEVLDRWVGQRSKGLRIGCDQYLFHFGTGMWVRNVLRDIIKDDDLPAVDYPDGRSFHSWDDCYYGAIDAVTQAWEESHV